MMANQPSPQRPVRVALSAPQIVAKLAQLQDWRLCGDGPDLAIEKDYVFKGYLQTIAFVNAVAFLAEHSDHHPELLVGFKRCSVRWRSHDVKGISLRDFECAAKVDGLLGNDSPPGHPVG